MESASIRCEDGAYCPRCGYDQRGVPAAGERRCAECGLAYEEGDLLKAPPPMWLARVVRISSILLAVMLTCIVLFGGLIAIAESTRTCRCRPRTAAWNLRWIHEAAAYYASDHDGAYPPNLAVLLRDEYTSVEEFMDPQGRGAGTVRVGDVDLVSYDWSEESAAALRAAIAAEDSERPFYQLGDFWFARLATPRASPDLVFGWSLPDANSQRWVIFDDGTVEQISGEAWDELWQRDGGARQALGLNRIPPPPDTALSWYID